MKFVRFSSRSAIGNEIHYGTLEDTAVTRIVGTPFSEHQFTNDSYQINEVKLHAPVMPSKVIAIGLNYATHAEELGMKTHDEPVMFMKPTTAVLDPGGAINYPAMSRQVDYEAELVIVIKKTAHMLDLKDAADYVLGYCCGNDVTARDLQKIDNQWTRAKSFDTFAPLGPFIETDVDPSDLRIRSTLNGEVKQDSTTALMIFKPDMLVYFISQVMTLLPGDVIMTGTPPGVGPMHIGDTIEVTIDGLGTLRNTVV